MITNRTVLLSGLLMLAAAALSRAGDHAEDSTPPDPTTMDTNAVLNDSRVRLRDSPGLDSQTISYLAKGDTVSVVGRSDSIETVGEQDAWSYWYHVTTSDSQDGFVYGTFLSSVSGKSPLPQWFTMSLAGKPHKGSRYYHVAVDASGNVYVAGSFDGAEFRFGKNAIIKGANDGENPVVAKYNAAGTALWARTIKSADAGSSFLGVTVDRAGNVYVGGGLQGDGVCDFGDGVTTKAATKGSNAVVVKYDKNGRAQWARTVTSGKADSEFIAVAVDSAGAVYGAGSSTGDSLFKFGDYVSTKGSASGDKNNVLLVKFDASGNTAWARSQSAGKAGAYYSAVAVDSSGSVYASGVMNGPEKFVFEGGGVSATGTAPKDGNDVLLVRYDSQGKPQWARTQVSGIHGGFYGVAIDQAGNIVAAGYVGGDISFGKDVSFAGTPNGLSGVVAWFSPDGTALRATGVIDAEGGDEYFTDLAATPDGGVCAAGKGPTGGFMSEFDSNAGRVWDYWLANVTPAGRLAEKGVIESVAADSTGTVYTAGSTTVTDDADYGVLVKY